jgi:Tfp pilus assembly protein PilO
MILTVAVGVVINAVIYLAVLSPAMSAKSSETSALETATQAFTTISSQYSTIQRQGSGGAALFQSAKSLDALLPQLCSTSYTASSCFNPTDFALGTMSSLITSSGMKPTQVVPGVSGTYQTAFYEQYSFTVTGTYAQLVSLVRNLANAPQMITTASIAATATPAGVSANIVIDVWYMNNPATPPVT